MAARSKSLSVLFAATLLLACASGHAVAQDDIAAPSAPSASRAEAQAIAAQFDLLAGQLESIARPQPPLTGAERQRLRSGLSYLLAYLDAPSWRDERILQIEREIAKIEADRTGIYSGDAQEFTRQWEASGQEIGRLRADIRALRSAPEQEGVTGDASPPITLPSPAERVPTTQPPSRSSADVIGEMERLLTPPGRLRARDKLVLRGRLDGLIASLEAPPTRAEEIEELKNRLAGLQRFNSVGPVEGSNELYDRYRRAVEAEAERLREQIRRLEARD
jgi:plasmid stabilization system protein ParE